MRVFAPMCGLYMLYRSFLDINLSSSSFILDSPFYYLRINYSCNIGVCEGIVGVVVVVVVAVGSVVVYEVVVVILLLLFIVAVGSVVTDDVDADIAVVEENVDDASVVVPVVASVAGVWACGRGEHDEVLWRVRKK